jgi:hypothetical protein
MRTYRGRLPFTPPADGATRAEVPRGAVQAARVILANAFPSALMRRKPAA